MGTIRRAPTTQKRGLGRGKKQKQNQRKPSFSKAVISDEKLEKISLKNKIEISHTRCLILPSASRQTPTRNLWENIATPLGSCRFPPSLACSAARAVPPLPAEHKEAVGKKEFSSLRTKPTWILQNCFLFLQQMSLESGRNVKRRSFWQENKPEVCEKMFYAK